MNFAQSQNAPAPYASCSVFGTVGTEFYAIRRKESNEWYTGRTDYIDKPIISNSMAMIYSNYDDAARELCKIYLSVGDSYEIIHVAGPKPEGENKSTGNRNAKRSKSGNSKSKAKTSD